MAKGTFKCPLVPICLDWQHTPCDNCFWLGIPEGVLIRRTDLPRGDEQSSSGSVIAADSPAQIGHDERGEEAAESDGC